MIPHGGRPGGGRADPAGLHRPDQPRDPARPPARRPGPGHPGRPARPLTRHATGRRPRAHPRRRPPAPRAGCWSPAPAPGPTNPLSRPRCASSGPPGRCWSPGPARAAPTRSPNGCGFPGAARSNGTRPTGPPAGPPGWRRNAAMVAAGADVCLAFIRGQQPRSHPRRPARRPGRYPGPPLRPPRREQERERPLRGSLSRLPRSATSAGAGRCSCWAGPSGRSPTARLPGRRGRARPGRVRLPDLPRVLRRHHRPRPAGRDARARSPAACWPSAPGASPGCAWSTSTRATAASSTGP